VDVDGDRTDLRLAETTAASDASADHGGITPKRALRTVYSMASSEPP
jgi:hypothetical protein